MKTDNMQNLFKVTNKVMDVILVSFLLTYFIQCHILLTLNQQTPAEYPQNMSQLVLVSFYKVILLNFRSVPNIFKVLVVFNFKAQPTKSI